MTVYLTAQGYEMNFEKRKRIIDVLTNPENDGLSQKDLAFKAKVALNTFRRYLTEETWDAVKLLRLDAVRVRLAQVDMALFQKAVKGDVAAARLLYSRWDDLTQEDKTKEFIPENLDEIEGELKRLKEEIKRFDET